ncbi:MAG: hypothetical protein JXB38_21615, partial [Anaerolineales bacterium]|nr:hypothetical protein [Anaerolineales bacterium]
MSARDFYHTSTLSNPTRAQILAGEAIKINPALVTLVDGQLEKQPLRELQAGIHAQVSALLDHKVRTFHIDINYPEYGGFGGNGPEINTMVFTPAFVAELNKLVQTADAYLNLHLLTTFPHKRLRAYENTGVGAVCFQLDAVPDRGALIELMARITEMSAVPSPVIETVGTENLPPKPPDQVFDFLKPVLSQVGMLTFQAAGTGSRSNLPGGSFSLDALEKYIAPFKATFKGTIQVQGGITTET